MSGIRCKRINRFPWIYSASVILSAPGSGQLACRFRGPTSYQNGPYMNSRFESSTQINLLSSSLITLNSPRKFNILVKCDKTDDAYQSTFIRSHSIQTNTLIIYHFYNVEITMEFHIEGPPHLALSR